MSIKLNNWFKKRYYRLENRTSSVPTLSRAQVIKDTVLFFAGLMGASFLVLILLTGNPNASSSQPTEALPIGLSDEELKNRPDGPQVISFRVLGTNGTTGTKILRSKGSLIRARILNNVETHESVPVFAQIIDYGLGTHLYGKTIIGDASSDGGTQRIKIAFHTLRISDYSAKDVTGQALSLDGTLGLSAEKKEGIFQRSVLGSTRSGLSNSVDQDKLGESIQGFLVGALLRGLQTELSSDIGSEYNEASVLSLDPGVEFFIQLTENYGEGQL